MDYKTLSPSELATRCLSTGEESAWTEFVQRFHPLIASVVVRVGSRWGQSSRDVIDDLVQETYLKLCADREHFLQHFKSTHPDAILGFVKVFTANLVHDHFKAIRSQKRGGRFKIESVDDPTANAGTTSSDCTVSSIERAVLIREIDSCMRELDKGPNATRDRHIFWLYYRVGLPASAIAALPAIALTTKGVESTLLRITRAVRKKLSGSRDMEPDNTQAEGISPSESL